MKIKALDLIKIIVFAALITLACSIKTSFALALIVALTVVITLIVTNFLYRYNNKYLDVILIIIASAEFSFIKFAMFNELHIFDILCNVFLAIAIYLIAKLKKK